MRYLKLNFCQLLLLIFVSGTLKAQTISTIIGTGVAGRTGDGGPATAATVGYVYGIYVDGAGNIYIGDVTEQRVRKVAPTGIITTIGGGGSGGGDGIPATDASIINPCGMTMDPTGNLYISDEASNKVRMISPAGIINTFAGSGVASSGIRDGGPATAAYLYEPAGIAQDGAGNFYITDMGNHRIRKVDATGIITTVGGTGTPGYTGDGGPATAAEIQSPWGIAVDASGNVYFSDIFYHTIRMISTTGIMTTIAGIAGTSSYSGDGGPATAATFDQPYNIAFDAAGDLFVVDQGNDRIRKINTSGIISTYAFSGISGTSGDGGLAIVARTEVPYGFAVDNGDNMYVGDYSHRVRYITDTLHLGAIGGVDSLCAGSVVTMTDTTAGGVWSSSDITIATADSSTGAVTGVSAGQVIISYTKYGISITDSVTVDILPGAGSITGDTAVCAGDSTRLTDAIAGGSWSAANGLATVGTSGMVTAGSIAGTDTIYYSMTNACGTASIPYTMTVLSTALCALRTAPASIQMQPELKIFPNPNNGSCNLLLTAPVNEDATATVTDCLGQKVQQVKIAANVQAQLHIPATGTYFISVNYAGVRYTRAVTVVKE